MYDDDLRVPLWVGYQLKGSDLLLDRERTECFRRDIRLPFQAAAFCFDYEEPVFDRGHMVPNADMVRSEVAMINTYIFSNMCPMHDRFNRGIWSSLESRVRKWAKKKGQIYVITGAVFDKNGDQERDADGDADTMESNEGIQRVAVPTHFYKIILHTRPNGFIDSMALLLPHVDSSPGSNQTDSFLISKLVTIDDIEEVTGIDFLVGLRSSDHGAAKENAIETFLATSLWLTE
jgi:endonuclease G